MSLSSRGLPTRVDRPHRLSAKRASIVPRSTSISFRLFALKSRGHSYAFTACGLATAGARYPNPSGAEKHVEGVGVSVQRSLRSGGEPMKMSTFVNGNAKAFSVEIRKIANCNAEGENATALDRRWSTTPWKTKCFWTMTAKHQAHRYSSPPASRAPQLGAAFSKPLSQLLKEVQRANSQDPR